VSDKRFGYSGGPIATGISEYETDHRTDRRPGLGLAIVKAFVEAHDERWSVESEPGRGSIFAFRCLPLSRNNPRSAASREGRGLYFPLSCCASHPWGAIVFPSSFPSIPVQLRFRFDTPDPAVKISS